MKFKIGDTVKLVTNANSIFPKDAICKIVKINSPYITCKIIEGKNKGQLLYGVNSARFDYYGDIQQIIE